MSKRTYNEGGKNFVKFVQPTPSDLEVVLSFDQFPEAKTAKNIAQWLQLGHVRGGIKPDYLLCHSTDGASNAKGSAMEYKAILASMKSKDIVHYTCFAHQVNRSAKFASGMGDFVENSNIELSDVLKKMHAINSRIYRNEGRLKVLYQVQKDNKRYVFFWSIPCCETFGCLTIFECLSQQESDTQALQRCSHSMEFRTC